MTLDDVVTLAEAAETFGRSQASFQKAAYRGALEAKLVGPRVYITTREAAAVYVARVTARRLARKRHPLP